MSSYIHRSISVSHKVRSSGIAAILLVIAVISGCSVPGESIPDEKGDFVNQPPSCTGTWSGGTLIDGTGGTVVIPEGTVSQCSNIAQSPVLMIEQDVPANFPVSPAVETVVTAIGDARSIDTGGTGFNLSPGNYITISLPFDSSRLPAGAVVTSVNTFIRLWDIDRDIASDVSGKVDTVSGTVTATLIGLPARTVATVLHRPGRVAATADGQSVARSVNRIATDLPPWPGTDWCVIHDVDSSELRDAVRTIEYMANDPDAATITTSVRARVAAAGRLAQSTYETLGLRAPWLYVSNDPEGPCGDILGATPRYEIYVIDGEGSHYKAKDPDEATGPGDRHFGRLYVRASRIGDGLDTNLGTVKASVAHEMTHAIQQGYEILTNSTVGFNEGTATVAGVYVDRGTIGVRKSNPDEVFRLPYFLMVPNDALKYSNQDFFAFVANRYSGSQLSFLPIVFGNMRDLIEAEVQLAATPADAAAIRVSPGVPMVFKALDQSIRTVTPALGLRELYIDFMTERAFWHGVGSVFGREGETQSGFAAELFGVTVGPWGTVREVTASMATCDLSRGSIKLDGICPFSARAIRIAATDVPSPARKASLQVTMTTTAGERVIGYTIRNDELQSISQPMTFEDFGATAGDEVVVLVGDVLAADDCETSVTIDVALTCDEPPPDGEDPMKCGSSGIPACNDVPAMYYWRRACEEYTGSHWASDWGTLQNMCLYASGAEWCDSGCSRSNILGTCSISFGENSDVVFYYYTTVDYAAEGFDPAASCGEDGGTWQ